MPNVVSSSNGLATFGEVWAGKVKPFRKFGVESWVLSHARIIWIWDCIDGQIKTDLDVLPCTMV